MKKKTKLLFASIAALTALVWPAEAQTYDTNNDFVETFAGYGIPGYVDGQGQFTAFSSPSQIVADTSGNLYVWDSGNSRIRKITADGTVSTLAGGGSYFEGYGTNVSLAWGTGGTLAMDHANTLWLVLAGGYNNYDNSYLVTIGTNGFVSIANAGLTNLGAASGLCFDSANNLYYSGGNRIYRYSSATGASQAFAGSGIAGNFDGQGVLFSAFNNPGALACDQADNLYVFDAGNVTIRRIDKNQNVTTVAGNDYSYYQNSDGVGTNATFYGGVASMFADHQGNLYFVCGDCIRKMNVQTNVVTLAGVFSQYGAAFANGPGYQARFSSAAGGCISQGTVFIADTGNHRIRSITFNPEAQIVPPANLQLNTYPGLQITGTIGRSYQIQSSPNLNAWTPVATLLLNSSPYLWFDQNPVAGNKFYRAVLLP
jgi:sugar lactone lactonase YvrE